MPLAGFVCPPGAPTAGNRNEVRWCVTKCPHPCIAPPLMQAIYEAEVANHHFGTYISASMLAGGACPRQVWFERREPFFEHPMRRYWAFRGTHAHSIIERAQVGQYGWLQELRMKVPLVYPDEPAPIFLEDGTFTGKFDESQPLTIVLGGTTDAYSPVAPPFPLWDFKSMADAKAEMMVKGKKPGKYSKNIDDRWVRQLNIYRLLVSKTKLSTLPLKYRKRWKLKGEFLPTPEWIGIQGIGMMHAPRTGQPYFFHRGREAQVYPVDDVPILPLDEVEGFVRAEARKWYRWLVLGEMPPVVSKEDDWLCKSCAFNGELIEGERCFPKKERGEAAPQDVSIELED